MRQSEISTMRWWHGSSEPITDFNVRPGLGGIHFGTIEQARARNASRFLHGVELRVEAPCRGRDRQDWKAARRTAISRKKDAIVYLNRHEGMSTERLDSLRNAGLLDKIDNMTDREFLKAVPEARDSIMVLHADMVRPMCILDRDGNIVWERKTLTADDGFSPCS